MDKKLRINLVTTAKRDGICSYGLSKLESLGKDELVNYYIANPDWCMEREYPDINILREFFSDCEDKGIFIGKTFSGENMSSKQAYIFHNCTGEIEVGINISQGIIPMLYLANNCNLKIKGVGVSELTKPVRVPIYTFGSNKITAKSNKYVSFVKYDIKLL